MLNGAIVLLALLLQNAANPAQPELTITFAAEKTEVVIGEEIQAEVVLTNVGDRAADVAELVFEERSLSFEMTFEAGAGKNKNFFNSVTKPDPHLAERVAPARVTLSSKRALTGLFRIPTLKTGTLTVVATYKGAGKEVRSSPATLRVAAGADGASRLAATVVTSQGDIQIDLMPDEAPNSVANFVQLVRRGFYGNMNVFRVIRGQWFQAGCPYENGVGHAGYAVKSEAEGQTATFEPGTVGLSQNLKAGFTGSQFFIDVIRQTSHDKKFTVIGRVPESRMDVVKKIGGVETDKATDRPKEEVRIREIRIVVVK